ncbi:MAG: hypothetical protein GF418_12110, partial [Chitinivibrionales bacterium]|nr:hypothetical protein [Chitinivibrionales bacterium]MBD3396362.1 hypothetical protein [Chitinivibrionales bacterium]
MKQYHAVIVFAILAVLLLGCSTGSGPDDVAGGGDEFPNSAALGKRMAEELDAYDNWDDDLQAVQAVPEPTTSAGLDIESTAQGLARSRRAAVDSTVTLIDSSDTADGIVRVTVTVYDAAFVQYDTLLYAWDDAYRDAVAGNEHFVYAASNTVFGTDSVVYYCYADSDGDGVINDPAAPTSRASSLTMTRAGDAAAYAYFEVDAGPDRDFDTESDNLVLAGWAFQTLGTDTVASYGMADADGDGILVDAGSADSCLIDVWLMQDSTGFAGGAKWWLSARFVVFPYDSTKDYI